MSKPFLTIEEQVDLLNSRGMSTDTDTARILLREGYYSIVNGYKEPFLDTKATIANKDDRYREGARFSDMYTIFSFDRELRETTFYYLIMAEATIKTAVAYVFSEAHREPNAYLLQENFCSRDEFCIKKSFEREISGLNTALNRRLEKSRTEFVTHYKKTYGDVPLWVLVNDLTFGNVEHFFNLMKPEEQDRVCRAITESTARKGDGESKYLSKERARVSLEALVDFRNICAHDERLYCTTVGGRKNINYIKMIFRLEQFITKGEFIELIGKLLDLVKKYSEQSKVVYDLLKPLGFDELSAELAKRNKIREERRRQNGQR